jgi:hypothetical protein
MSSPAPLGIADTCPPDHAGTLARAGIAKGRPRRGAKQGNAGPEKANTHTRATGCGQVPEQRHSQGRLGRPLNPRLCLRGPPSPGGLPRGTVGAPRGPRLSLPVPPSPGGLPGGHLRALMAVTARAPPRVPRPWLPYLRPLVCPVSTPSFSPSYTLSGTPVLAGVGRRRNPPLAVTLPRDLPSSPTPRLSVPGAG